jgi:predicted O-methyltransferase YrrM
MPIAAQLKEFIPPALKGWARFLRGSHKDLYPFGFAMNGQTARLEATRQILFGCQIKAIIETGTFRGTTTEWFAQFGVPVNSIEAHAPTYEFAKRRLGHLGNVSVEFGDSVRVLESLMPKIAKAAPTFVYLDAHWENYLPLRDEIDLICAHLTKPVILIDDFEVPGDPGYTFDNYGPGKALTEDYLRACKFNQLEKFYPAVPSAEETGGKRGWIVLAGDPAMIQALNRINLLKPARRAPA